ncbi:hypothetical protein BGX38DRAFT_1212348 [Terfezia claveryi]|nr:hypothetical protein BGX38DRAFT_1212348 [Terfezia claveryi]
MPRVSEKKESRLTKVTQVTKTRLDKHTTTIKTTTSGKPTSGPKPPLRGIVATKNSKPSTPIKHKTTHETTRKPSSTKIVPARLTELQTMAMRPVKDGRSEWKLKVKGPTPGETIVERGFAVRSGNKITTGLLRVENLNSGHSSSGRKNSGSSNKLSAGNFFEF